MSVNDLPTPDELGEKLKAGEITREEAVEIMSERARREAFASMYGAAGGEGDREGNRDRRYAGVLIAGGILLLVVLLLILTQFL